MKFSKVTARIEQFLGDIDSFPDGHRTLEHIRQIARFRCQNDLHFFVYHALEYRDINTELHRDMCNRWMARMNEQYTMWLIPRGHLKTSIWTEGACLFDLIKDPNQRILITNAKLENAVDILSNIKAVAETKEIFRWLFPEYCPDLAPNNVRKRCKWEVARLDFPCSVYAGRREGNIKVMGVEASLVSQHYEIIHYDDPVNDINTATRMYRNKIDKWYKDSLQLRHDPGKSKIRLIGTFWHEDDLFNRLIKQERDYRAANRSKNPKAHKFLIYIRKVVETPRDETPGIEIVGKKNVLPIWPERFTPEVIEDTKLANGSYVFGCQYMLEPVSSEDAVFKKDDVKIIQFFDMPERLINFMAVDLAASEKDESDYTAITVASFDEYGRMYIREIVNRRMMVNETLEKIWELCQKWNCQRVGIETTVFQYTVYRFYQSVCIKNGWNIPWVEMKRPMVGKLKRILALQPRVERGDFLVEEGIAGINDLLDQMTTLTMDHLPAFDDILDTLADLEQINMNAPKEPNPPVDPESMEAIHGSLLFDDSRDTYTSSRLASLSYGR